MTLKLGEVLLDAAVTKLRANMGQAVAALNADRGGDPQIGAPAATSYHKVGAMIPAGGTPAIVVGEGPGEFEGEGADGAIWVATLIVRVIDDDHSTDRLALRLRRLAPAVIAALVGADPAKQLPGAAHYVFPLRTQPGPFAEPDNETDAWRSYYDVWFVAHQFEDI